MPPKTLSFLYDTRLGALFLKLLATRWIANAYGAFLSSRLSKPDIKRFIKRHGIDMSEYEQRKYRSFNDFFTRKILPQCRPTDATAHGLVSPCDGKLTAFKIDENSIFKVKGFDYSMETLLRSDKLAKEFSGGTCLIFRLTVTDYHRYMYFDGGTAEKPVFIKGKLHTVQPHALEKRRVFTENCREYTLLHTDNFGDVLQIEVGAMFVGRIVNHDKTKFGRGEEKGYFEFGGSTIILILKQGVAEINGEIFQNTADGRETEVKCGERIGSAITE